MRPLVSFASNMVALALAACSLPGSQSSDDAGTGSSGSDDSGTVAVTGLGCANDPPAGAPLCTAVSLCPGLLVDHDVFPNCGFRVAPGSSILDLECDCNGMLCPVGVAVTCAQAKTLLDTQTEVTVCTQISEGRCTGFMDPMGGDAGTSSGCDHDCQSRCAGDPNCYKLCGC